MRWINRIAVLALGSALAACGGGGSDAGAPPFGSAASAPTGNPGPAPGGGISVVSSGVPSQKYMSISVGTYNQDWSFDGDTTTITIRVADSAGNPVPEGTIVQFSTEGGQIQKSCRLSGTTATGSTLSTCSVTFGTQELRPLDRLVGVVAWMEGEEAYADLNGNGKYDTGEPFYDSGKIFRDDDHDGQYTANRDEINVGDTVSGGQLGTGTSACAANQPTGLLNNVPMSVTGTCDGAWGKTLVRANVTLAVSDPRTIDAIPGSALPRFATPACTDPSDTGVPAGSIEVFSSSFIDSSIRVAAPFGTSLEPVNVPSGCTVSISPPAVSQTSVCPTRHTVTSVGTCGATIGVKVAFAGVFEKVVQVTPAP